MIIYLDESGDLGFDWLRAKTSTYFIVTVLVCEDLGIQYKFKQAVRRTLAKLNHKKTKSRIVVELKGTQTNFAIKKYLYSKLPLEGWKIYSVALNKKRVLPHLQTKTGKKKLYNYLARFVIENIDFSNTIRTVNLVVDRCKNTEEIKDFNSYLENHLQALLPLNTRLDITHETSHENTGLQLVDMFFWGIARKSSAGDKEWYSIFQEKIVYEEVIYLDNKKDGPFNT